LQVIAVHDLFVYFNVTDFKSPQFQEQISLLDITLVYSLKYLIDDFIYMMIIIYRDNLFRISTTSYTHLKSLQQNILHTPFSM